MPALSVPTPQLEYEAVGPGLAVLEKPLEIRCTTVTFPDGGAFDQTDLGSAGLYLYRQETPGVTEIWNKGEKVWQPDPGVALGDLKAEPLIFKLGEEAPWQGLLVAAGQKDRDGADQFRKATTDLPRYLVRAYFATTRNGNTFSGLSGPSATVRFTGAGDAMLAGIGVPEGKTPRNADEVTFFLRNSSLQPIGAVVIQADDGSAQIEVSNYLAGTQKAVIRLLATGDVEIQPAPGRKLIVAGVVEAG